MARFDGSTTACFSVDGRAPHPFAAHGEINKEVTYVYRIVS